MLQGDDVIAVLTHQRCTSAGKWVGREALGGVLVEICRSRRYFFQ